ncbi:MAG: tetratricopeptide repeat protein [Planctomycetota bacterium]
MNRLFVISILVSLIGVFVFANDDEDMALTYYQSGVALQKENKPNEAVEKFTKALTYKNDFPEALFRLGECYEKLQNIPSAIKNYRLCLRCLECKTSLNSDEKSISLSARKNLDKIDAKNAQVRNEKSKYIDKLAKVGGECAAKKYYNFSRRIYNLILAVDPGNKAASDAIRKIPADNAGSKPAEGQIFNGADLDGWTVNTNVWLNLWSVEKPCLVFNRTPAGAKQPSGEPSPLLLASKSPLPEDYTLSFEVFVEKRWGHATAHCVGFIYGEAIQSTSAGPNVVMLQKIECDPGKIGEWKTIKFIKEGNKFTIQGPGTAKRSGNLDKYHNKVIGLWAQGFTAKLKNIILTPKK